MTPDQPTIATPAVRAAVASKPAGPARALAALLGFDAGDFAQALIAKGELSQTDWRLAEEVARQGGSTPTRALVELGLIGEDALADALADHVGARRWRLKESRGVVSDLAPRAFQRGAGAIALEETGAQPGEIGAITIVVADPADRRSVRALAHAVEEAAGDRSLSVALGALNEITAALESEEAASPAESSAESPIDVEGELSALRDMASEAPVIRFFNQAIERALDLGASDVHIERFDRKPSLRLRVDGFLVEQPPPPEAMIEALLCRIKILAGLDIAQRRLAQDGRIRLRLRGRIVDLRVSLIPTMYGQDAAIRIQDRRALQSVELSTLGFFGEQADWLDRISRKSHGMLLITGPTGSGKTTTLYALLKRLAARERKIITVEDPVEYAMEGVNQIQVNPAIGLSFANTLRHVLRHDPDVILVGEIRDAETAQMAFQAALTGHMVLSTLHTNDAPGAITRLIEMGVESYLVNAAVAGATAQRLLRKLCAACSNEPAKRDACQACAGLGYKGRVAVMEQLEMSADLRSAIAQGAEERDLRAALASSGYQLMRVAAARLIDDGLTDDAEIARVLGAVAASADVREA